MSTRLKPINASKKRNILSQYFSKVKRNSENNYLLASLSSVKGSHNQRLGSSLNSPNIINTFQSKNSKMYSSRYDKQGKMKQLEKLDVTKMSMPSFQNLKNLSDSVTSLCFPQSNNVIFRPGEVHRKIGNAITSLRMKKFADIINYNPADNVVLQTQMRYLAGPKSNSQYKSNEFHLSSLPNLNI